MRNFILYISLVIVCLEGVAQEYSNHWIDYSKEYVRIPVAEDGMYKLTYDDLNNIGLDLSSIDPQSMGLFHRGEQIAVLIEGESDGQFNANDLIVFYGEGNDGLNESGVYLYDALQVHTKYSLFSDTSAYFLTWDLPSPLRMKDLQVSSATEEAVYRRSGLFLDTQHYSTGEQTPDYVYVSEGDRAEGWFSALYPWAGATFNHTFDSVFVSPDATSIHLEIAMVGRNSEDHSVTLDLANESFEIDGFSGYDHKIYAVDISSTNVVNNALEIKLHFNGVNGAPEAILMAYVEIEYESEGNLGSDLTNVIGYEGSNDSLRLDIQGVSGANRCFDIGDRAACNLVSGDFNGDGFLSAIAPDTNGGELIFVDYANLLRVSDLTIHTYSPLDFSSNYLIVTNRMLEEAAVAYADYRSSSVGGGYNVTLAYVDEIYDEYSFGEKNPLAIKDLISDLYHNGDLEQIFILGRANAYNLYSGPINDYYRKRPNALDAGGEPYFPYKDLVPTMGSPYSDALFTRGLIQGNELSMGVPIGRLPIISNAEGLGYLNKVKEYESFGFDDLWMKRSLMLSGGKTTNEQTQYKNYIGHYQNLWEGYPLGGESRSFSKNSNQNTVFYDITDQVNEGVGLISYFGHSAPNFIEIEIGDIHDDGLGYNNKGKYPILYLNGCNALTLGQSTDEQNRAYSWVLAEDKGAIAAFGHTSYGYSTTLHTYCSLFHSKLVSDSTLLTESIGSALSEASKLFMTGVSESNTLKRSQAHQLILIGDPAIKHFPAANADFSIESKDVTLTAVDFGDVTATTDSVLIELVINNFGRAFDDSLTVRIDRKFALGDSTIHYKIKAPSYSDTMTFIIPNLTGVNYEGVNSLSVWIDSDSLFDEYRENNNYLEFEFYQPSYSQRHLTPLEFGVYPTDSVRFVAQLLDLSFTEGLDWEMEIDTVNGFDNPLKLELSSGSVADFGNILLPYGTDSSVVYFRSRVKSGLGVPDTNWLQSSFMLIEGETGWGQANLHQLMGNELEGLQISPELNQVAFLSNEVSLSLRTPGVGVIDYTDEILIEVENQAYVSKATGTVPDYCRVNGILAIALDRETGVPFHWDGLTGSCGLGFNIGSFGGNAAGLENYLAQYEDRDIVVISTIGNAKVPNWRVSLKDSLKSMGANFLDSVQAGIPYQIVLEVGGDVLYEAYGDSIEQILKLDTVMSFYSNTGKVISPPIYGAGRWNHFAMKSVVDGADFGTTGFYSQSLEDSLVYLTVKAVDTLIPKVSFHVPDTKVDSIDYARLEFVVSDTSIETPATIGSWVVNFDPIMELIFPNKTRRQWIDVVQVVNAGEVANWDLVLNNVSSGPSEDSINVMVVYSGEGFYEVDTIRIANSFGMDSVAFEVSMITDQLSGEYEVLVIVNPEMEPEQFYDNNAITLNLEVVPDLTSPILEVTYDGYFIQNGDFISSQPEIEMVLREYNPFLKRSDTLNWYMEVAEQCETNCQYSDLRFGSPEVSYSIGSITENFKVLYTPDFSPGVYRLKVNASDASGNYAGLYEQEFEVSDQTGLSYFYPYPNPFSGSCRFVYKFLGEVIPTDFELVITTLAGHEVRVLSASELGGIRIGTNLSEYYWDGTDSRGNQLSNGVYLYKLIIKDGTTVLETDADGLIKGGIGKLYIAN